MEIARSKDNARRTAGRRQNHIRKEKNTGQADIRVNP
jgi:hypothetical protein